MTNERAQQHREECRRAVRAYLAERAGLSFGIPAITRGVARDGGFERHEVEAALAYLTDKGHAASEPDPDGATPYFRITADGTLAYERL